MPLVRLPEPVLNGAPALHHLVAHDRAHGLQVLGPGIHRSLLAFPVRGQGHFHALEVLVIIVPHQIVHVFPGGHYPLGHTGADLLKAVGPALHLGLLSLDHLAHRMLDEIGNGLGLA